MLSFYKIADYNSNIFNDYEAPGLKIRKILYLKEKNIENLSLKKIVVYCLNDYRNNKNFSVLKLASSFSKNYFYLNYKYNIAKSYKFYNFFMNSFKNIFIFNSDVSYLSTKLKYSKHE